MNTKTTKTPTFANSGRDRIRDWISALISKIINYECDITYYEMY